ncbi:retrotransposon protein, putative, ty1-copia subclass [Tanacetum coccineum]
MRRAQESGAEDDDYYARALFDYEAEHRIPFTLRHYWEILKEFGDTSINLNVDVGDDEEDEVQELRRPIGRNKAKVLKKKGPRSSGLSSSTNDEAFGLVDGLRAGNAQRTCHRNEECKTLSLFGDQKEGCAVLRLIWNMVKTLSDEIMVKTSSDEIILRYLSSLYPSEHILLVPPAISYWIMNCQRREKDTKSLREFLKPLNLPSKKLIIFPVNNNDNMAMADGESLQITCSIRGVSPEPRYMEFEGSPQDNDYDCGLYVLATAKNYLKEQTLYKLNVKIYSENDPTSGIRACVETLNKKNSIDVIVNGDLEEEPAPTGETSAPTAPKNAKQLAAKRNQERVKSILLLAIPDEYLLKFHNVADAKSLWEAIKSRFGGNEESKKMQKNVLKHQFENFFTTSNESLDKAYDRFQKLISQLEVHGAPIPKEDINRKFLIIYDAHNEVAYLMLGSMTPELHRQFENYSPYEMLQELKSMFEKQVGVERLSGATKVMVCASPQILVLPNSLNGLTSDFAGFVRNYNMHNMGKTIGELHALLIEYEKGLPKKAATPQVMAIQGGRIQKANKKLQKAKGKEKGRQGKE